MPDWRWPLASAVLLVAGSAAMTVAQLAVDKRQRWLVALWVGIGMLCLAAAFGLELRGHALAPLRPVANAWSATVAALLSWQGFHVLVLWLMGAYVVARRASGKLLPDARASLDNTVVLWHYVTLQGLAGMGVIYLMPFF